MTKTVYRRMGLFGFMLPEGEFVMMGGAVASGSWGRKLKDQLKDHLSNSKHKAESKLEVG